MKEKTEVIQMKMIEREWKREMENERETSLSEVN